MYHMRFTALSLPTPPVTSGLATVTVCKNGPQVVLWVCHALAENWTRDQWPWGDFPPL